MNLQNSNLSEPMTQVGKEVVAGKWRGMMGGLDVQDTLQDALDQSYSRLSQLLQ
jgi:hypothetical protein